jgi:hypothetical protein
MGLIYCQQISTPREAFAQNWQFITYLAGGGVANLLTGCAAILITYLLAIPGFFLLPFAVISVVLGSLNLVPFRTKNGVSSDGAGILALTKNGADAQRFRAAFDFVTYMFAGVRPREWAISTVQTLQENAVSDYEKALSFLLAYQYAMDSDNTSEAIIAMQQLELLYTAIPTALRAHFAVDLAYHFGIIEPQAAKARAYATDASSNGYLLSPASKHRALAAAAWVEGDIEEARKQCDYGLSVVNQGVHELDRMMEREWLLALKLRFNTSP